MQKIFKILKKIFSKTSIIIFMCLFGASLFFFWSFYERQYHKCIGMYDVYRGDKAYKTGDLQKAIDFYTEGLNHYPAHYDAWFNLGNIYVSYEDYYSAAEAYRNAIEYNKKFTLARMNLGIISAEKLGDFDGAIFQYQSIINSRGFLWFIPFVFSNKKSEKFNKGLAYYNMGVAYREKSLYQDLDKEYSASYMQKAIESYVKAADILNDDYDSRYNLALMYQLTGDFQNAGLNYCKAIEISPMNYEAHYNLAVLLKHLKMYKEAYNEIEKATILVTNNTSNINVTNYVFDVLNEISRILIVNGINNHLVEKLDNESGGGKLSYVHGKIVSTASLDRAILNNFKTCQSENYFKNNKDF